MREEILIPLMFFLTVIILALGIPLIRALSRRWEHEGRRPAIPSELAARFERLEQTIDAMALEIERISEGQRFTTRLLSDRTDGSVRLADRSETGPPGRSS